MLDKLFDIIKRTPDRIATQRTQLETQGDQLIRKARHQASVVRGDGRERIWRLETDALEWADGVLDRAHGLPIVGRVADPMDRWVEVRFERTTTLPIEGYEVLNARNASRAVRSLSRVDLLRVERHELATKNRKTVLDAISREQSKRLEMPVALAA